VGFWCAVFDALAKSFSNLFGIFFFFLRRL
jgi:hypothetical protein